MFLDIKREFTPKIKIKLFNCKVLTVGTPGFLKLELELEK